jgi:hypothetical protein
MPVHVTKGYRQKGGTPWEGDIRCLHVLVMPILLRLETSFCTGRRGKRVSWLMHEEIVEHTVATTANFLIPQQAR